MLERFDVCIIGSGSGNSILDDRFDGLSIAIVESGAFGGTCLNRGCIPSKMMIFPADLVAGARDAATVNVEMGSARVDVAALQQRTFGRIDPIAQGGLAYRQSLSNVRVFEGHGEFEEDGLLHVGDVTIDAEQWVLATGAHPHLPDIPGLRDATFHTSDTLMRIAKAPSNATILGGGFIACEMAHVLKSWGVEITMLIRGEHLLSSADSDVAALMTEEYARWVDLHTGCTFAEVAQREARTTITFTSKGQTTTHSTDLLVVATGRTPNSNLGLHHINVELDDARYVRVDRHGRTTNPSVWALGDVCCPLQLKHAANHMANVVRENLLRSSGFESFDLDNVPSAVFGHPQVGAVGPTEAELVASGRAFVSARREYASTAYGWAMGDRSGFAKLLADPKSGKLLGGHICGEQASLLIQPVALAVRLGLTPRQLARAAMYPHPALSEVVENAALELDQLLGEPSP